MATETKSSKKSVARNVTLQRHKKLSAPHPQQHTAKKDAQVEVAIVAIIPRGTAVLRVSDLGCHGFLECFSRGHISKPRAVAGDFPWAPTPRIVQCMPRFSKSDGSLE